jgi:hypothetical protein
MNTETMLEQIRRLNDQESVKHELRKEAAINKIRELRRAQREQEELKHKEKLCQTDYS